MNCPVSVSARFALALAGVVSDSCVQGPDDDLPARTIDLTDLLTSFELNS